MAQKPLSHSPVQIREYDRANNLVGTYIQSPSSGEAGGGRIDVVIPKSSLGYARGVLDAFLPSGYPHSVTSDYLEYQIYDSLQAFSSSIAGMLSSRAVLEGIGVGDSHASPTAALLLSVLQESMGRIATILFAHRLGSALEPECKMYRLAADIFNDSAMVLDCLSPALPKASRVFLLSMSSVLRSLCGVAAGSSKASLSAHFATQGNLGELNAKDSSQETIISLLGMLTGSLVVSHISSKWATWTAMVILLAIHLGTNYLAVRAVCMRTLNRQRANLVFADVLEKLPRIGTGKEKLDGDMDYMKYPRPEQIYLHERIFERDGVLRWGGEVLGYCRIGVDLQAVLNCFGKPDPITGSRAGSQTAEFSKLLNVFSDGAGALKGGYIVWYDEPRKTFLVVLGEGASARTQLSAWMFALHFAKFGRVAKDESLVDALSRTRAYVSRIEGKLFERLEEAGWDFEVGALEVRPGSRIKLESRT